jgi:hypothetical protein
MRALMCRTLRMLSFSQLIGLGSGHLARIDESIHAYVRQLFYRAGHARAQGLAAERIDLAIPLIVRSTILLLTLGNGSRHSWKQNEGGAGNCHPHSGTIFGSHTVRLPLAQQGQALCASLPCAKFTRKRTFRASPIRLYEYMAVVAVVRPSSKSGLTCSNVIKKPSRRV